MTEPLSVAIICQNAERTISRTLESVSDLAAEIVAIDSGSTDRTIDILRDHNAQVIEQDFLGYVAQKNAAIDACAHKWVLSLDADESLDQDAGHSIANAIVTDDCDGYRIRRRVIYAGRVLRYAWQPDVLTRLVRREHARWVGGSVHERFEVNGRIGELNGAIIHDTVDPIGDFLRRQIRYGELGANGQHSSLSRLAVSPIIAWMKEMLVHQAWRDGWRGWVAAGCVANAALVKHLQRVDAHRKNTSKNTTGEQNG
ncbi:MAG: glycosyltransferase family 2 protein [Planctomycetota bacterium]